MYGQVKAYLTHDRWGPILAFGTVVPVAGILVYLLREGGRSLILVQASLVAVLLGAGALLLGFRELRVRQGVRNTPTSTVRSLAIGPAEVKGRARPAGEPVRAPLSGTEAALVEVTVEAYHDTGDDGYWETLGRYRHPDAFLVDDGTGEVLVDPLGADIRSEPEETVGRSSGDPPPRELADLASEALPEDDDPDGPVAALPGPAQGLAQDVDDEGGPEEHLASPGNRRRRYVERVLEPGEQAYVLGYAERLEEAAAVENARNLVVAEPPRDGVFVVADGPEEQLWSRTRSQVLAYLVSGLAAVPMGAVGLLRVFGVV